MFEPAFELWGAATTWAELLGTLLGLAMVWCNIRVWQWGWPLAIASSLLYCAVFWRARLYGDAVLQVFFAVLGCWGWWQWRWGRSAIGRPLALQRLSTQGRWMCAGLIAVAWPTVGATLWLATDTDVPWWDAFPTAASLVGQFLLGRKYIENWPVWIGVNVVSVGLFAWKALWLTAGLYVVFTALAAVGWHAWHRQMLRHPVAS